MSIRKKSDVPAGGNAGTSVMATGQPANLTILPHSREPAIFSDLLAAYANVGAERDWFAEGAIEGRPIMTLAAGEKIGKSWMLIDLAVASVVGSKWLGCFPIQRPGVPVYVDTEYGEHEFSRRVARIARAHGRDPRDVLGRIRHVWAPDFNLNFDYPIMRELLAYAAERKPPVIVLDPWRNVIDGDENSAQDVVLSMGVVARLRDQGKSVIAIAHHLNRAGTMSGSRSLKGRSDLHIEGSDDEDEPYFKTISRTLRRNDPLQRRFRLDIAHEHDEDDTKAITTVGCRLEGESVERSALSKMALRVREVLASSTQPLTQNDVRRQANITNGHAVKRVLDELRDAGVAQLRDKKWSLATSEFFKQLADQQATAEEHKRRLGDVPF